MLRTGTAAPGPLTSRVRLTEVEQQPDGSYRDLSAAELVSANFEYANPPEQVVRKRDVGWDLSLMATVGTASAARPRSSSAAR